MGKKATTKQVGRSLVKARERIRRANRAVAVDVIKEADRTKKNLQSVTADTDLNEFLANVELNDRTFESEKMAATVIDQVQNQVLVAKRDSASSKPNVSFDSVQVHIPRRPAWDDTTSSEELLACEKKVFVDWRTHLGQLEADGIPLTPYEKNPDLWRELWRVLEKSDVVVEILDARNPLLFRCADLEAYVKELSPSKQILLLVNKADYLTNQQRETWADYFKSQRINYVFWSALGASEDEASQDCAETSSDGQSVNRRPSNLVMSRRELLQLFRSAAMPGSKDGKTFVGMVGYPNVGKSSTINKLVMQKRVLVSATPGKTKHLQTLLVDDDIVLCDAPGLIFPAVGLTKEHLVTAGILPIDTLTEVVSSVKLICDYVPKAVLESCYSLTLPLADEEGSSRVDDVLTCLAFSRGFMTSKGVPDVSRAGRMILKDFVGGKLMFCHAPPGCDQCAYSGYDHQSDGSNQAVNDDVTIVDERLKTLQRRHLLDGGARSSEFDQRFFLASHAEAHVRSSKISRVAGGSGKYPAGAAASSRKYFKNSKKEKLRRVYKYLDA